MSFSVLVESTRSVPSCVTGDRFYDKCPTSKGEVIAVEACYNCVEILLFKFEVVIITMKL